MLLGGIGKLNELTYNAKKKVTEFLVNKKRKSDNLTIDELDILKKEIENKLFANTMLTRPINVVGRTNSATVNNTLENLYTDLLVSFSCCDELDKVIDQYVQTNISSVNTLNASIVKSLDRINDFLNVLKTNGNPLYITEGFRDNSSFENNKVFYKERYGEQMPFSFRVDFNDKNENISIPLLRHANMIMQDNGVSNANISVRKQLGDKLMKINNSTTLENAIDSSLQSYWTESILTNEPIKVVYSDEKPTTPNKLKDFYYGIKQGALLELEIVFESISTINQLEITPFGKYPMELIAVRYCSTDDIDNDLEELIYPGNEEKALDGNVILDKTKTFNFKEINCKRLYIITNQIHYERSNYIINTNEIIKNDIWHNIVNEKNINKYISNEYIFRPNYLDRFIENKSFAYINEELIKNRKIDLNRVFFDNDGNIFKTVLKNKYTYGFYNIAAYYNDFNRTGIYVSKPIDPKKNIKTLNIITDETHQLSSDKSILTDIEYYITYSENPTLDDWIPILPYNKDYIYCEMLQLESDECVLRFPAKKIDTIFMNDILLKEGEDYIVHENEGYKRSIEIPNFNHRAIYRASYEPIDEAKTLNLIDSNYIPTTMATVDTIHGNNNNIFELKNCPYIDTNQTTKVRIVDIETGQVLFQDGEGIECVTDIINPSDSYMNFKNSENLKYQYYTYENKIYFNHPISNEFKVEVSYRHYISNFRLKALFRRNTFKDTWLTPTLNNIEYKITTIQ